MVSFLIERFFSFLYFYTFFFWAKIYFFFTSICGHKLLFCGHLGSSKYTFFFKTINLIYYIIFKVVITIVSYQNLKKKVYLVSFHIVNIKLFHYLKVFSVHQSIFYGLKFKIYDILFQKKKYI